MADQWDQFSDAPAASQALERLRSLGVEPTSGFRTQGDVERLRREGYTPAANGAHNMGDGVDLVPGKSGLNLTQLQSSARKEFGPDAKVEIHNGSHVHVAVSGWGLAPDLYRANPWDEFKDHGPAPKNKDVPQQGPSDAGHPTGQVHDGDTFRLSTGQNGRLLGVDAFELNQMGRSPTGATIPLGVDARNVLRPFAQPDGTVEATGDSTYGRPVVTLNNRGDAGEAILREGYGLAEPQYLKGDPERSAQYMEAERLARLNLLGAHGNTYQAPSDFRHGEPEAKTAVFFDEPMPFEGMRPEIAKQYQAIFVDPKSKPEDLIAFSKANGFIVSDDDAQKSYKARDEAFAKDPHAALDLTMRYLKPPRPLIDPGDGKFGTTMRGFGDPLNALDELGGVVDTVGGTGGRENVFNSDRRFGDILWNNIDQNRAILAHDEDTHPYYRLGGQLASAAILPGAGAETAAGRIGVAAAEGGAQGFMGGEGNFGDRAPDAALGTVLGAAGGAVLHGAIEAAPAVLRAGKRLLSRDGAVVDRAAQEAPSERNIVAAMAADRGDEVVGPKIAGADPYAEFPDAPFGTSRPTDQRLSPEEMAKLAEGVDPSSVLPRPSNWVGGQDEAAGISAGRFEPVKAPDELSELTVNNARPANGDLETRIRIRGPFDITKTLRQLGGVKDEGGDLAHSGITNAPRQLPFGGNEQFLGKLIDNENGMSLDEAGQRLHELGYFKERPTVAEVIDALHDEHLGQSRYLPEDQAQVADFHAAKAERYRVESAEADGSPLVEDRGHEITLDDLEANKPPLSAYEDRPRLNGRIGNINLDRLENPGDVSQLIKQIGDRVGGFSAASRGRITHEQTQLLSQEMGVKPEQLLRRVQGQALNAEQLYASRALVQRSREAVAGLAKRAVGGSDEDVATFRKGWLKHVALEEQITGATAEAGRALSQFRMLARAQDAGANAVRSYLKGAGGKQSIEDAANAIVDLMQDPGKASHFMREAVQPRWRDKFNELWINSLLSGPRTHVVNFVGNALTTALSFPEQAMTAGIGKLTRSADRAYFGEVGARAAGLADSSIEALRAMKTAFRTGDALDDTAKVEARQHEAIPGKLGTVIRTPTRALTAADEFWKTLLSGAELRQLAYRKAAGEASDKSDFAARYQALLRSPPDDLVKKAQASARYYTFQRELGPVGRGVQQISNNSVLGKILLPFVRTPSNIIKFAGERSVFGLAMPEVRQALRAGGRSRDEALARITLGSGLSTAAVTAALDGRVTGGGPTDSGERAALLQSGWQPYSIRVGDQWVSYQRFDPVSTLIGVAADFAEAGQWATRKEADALALNLGMGIAKNITNKTWLSGLSDAFDVLSDPERYGKHYVQKLISAAAVPAVLAQTAQSLDPHIRDARTIADAIKARVPVLSNDVAVRRNVWGEPVAKGDAIGPDILSPFYSSAVVKAPLNQEIARLRVPLTLPQRFLRIEGKRVDLTPEQYDQFIQLAGKPAKQALDQAIRSPAWRGMRDDERVDFVKETLKDFRGSAKDALLQMHPELAAGKPATPVNDDWAEFKDAK